MSSPRFLPAELRAVLDALPYYVLLVDERHCIRFANRATEAALGRKAEALIGQYCPRAVHGVDGRFPGCPLEEAVELGEPVERDVEDRASGRWLRSCVYPTGLRAEDGLRLYLHTAADITEQKQAEQAARTRAHDLTWLSEAAVELLSLEPEAGIYTAICRRLHALAGGGYAVVNAYDPATDEFTVMAVEGMSEKLDLVLQVLGRPPVGTKFRLSEHEKSLYASGALKRIDGGLAELSFGKLPEVAARALEMAFDLGPIYAVSFYRQERILGTVNILMPRGRALADTGMIETFVNHAAVSLHRRQLEDALRRSERRARVLADVVERSTQPFAITAPDGRLAEVNQACSDLTGYTRLELLAMENTRALTPAEWHKTEAERLAALGRGAMSVRYEKEYIRKDGTRVPVELLVQLHDDPAGVGRQNWVFVTDISERRQAEQRLRDSEGKYRSVVNHASEAIVVAQDGMLKFVNPAATRIVGRPEAELMAVAFTEFVHPADRELVADRHRRRIAGEDPESVYSFRVLQSDRSFRWVEISAVRVDWQGRPATLNFLSDITERKKTEAELEQHRQHLEELVRERTAALEQAQAELVRREKLATLGRIAGSVAHELRNPLGAIRNAVWYLNRQVGPSLEGRPARHLQIVVEQIERSNRVITSMLDFVRGRQAEPRFCLVANLVQRGREYATVPPSVGVDVAMPEGVAVQADPEQMAQALANLLTNAADAMNGTGRVTVSVRAAGREVYIAVADHGAGIRPEHMARLFEPLFSTKEIGTGLGLALSKSFVEANGGRIEVESLVGRGTTFTVILPAAGQGRAADR